MSLEPRKEVDIRGSTVNEVCENLATDVVIREIPYIASIMAQREFSDRVKCEHYICLRDGFAMAVEMILTGKLDLQLYQKEIENSQS